MVRASLEDSGEMAGKLLLHPGICHTPPNGRTGPDGRSLRIEVYAYNGLIVKMCTFNMWFFFLSPLHNLYPTLPNHTSNRTMKISFVVV